MATGFEIVQKCLSFEKGLSVQFRCDIDVRLRSALGSSGRGFGDRRGD